MNKEFILWNVFEISSKKSLLNGVMLRGRIRKLGLENEFNVLVENTEDTSNSVRFAVLNDEDKKSIIDYLETIIDDAVIELVMEGCANPVLSKLKVNIETRYTL